MILTLKVCKPRLNGGHALLDGRGRDRENQHDNDVRHVSGGVFKCDRYT